MLILLVALVALGIIAAVATKLLMRQGDDTYIVIPTHDCTTCNGDNDKCEQVCMMEASLKAIEYYDDEELDAYKGRPSESYTNEEAEQFREVLYTMRQDEVKGWSRSLILRGINIPNQLKDEVVMLIGD